MSLSAEQTAQALDLFQNVPDITTRKMFGGLALYSGGVIFAIVMSDGTTRLKGVGGMIDRYEALGMAQWVYQRPGHKPSAMPYWALPDSALDDPEEAAALAREALSFLG